MACGADWQAGGTTWVVGGQYEFDSYESAHEMQEAVREAHGMAPSGPYTSEATREDVAADVLADQTAGYK